MASRFHLYKRGKTWYYWYNDGEKQVKKTTGCDLKGDAEAFIDNLDAAERVAEEQSKRTRATFREVAEPMFLDKAAHLTRWAQKGIDLKKSTIAQHRRWIDLYLVPRWGDVYCDEIDEAAFEDWLMVVPSTKRGDSLSGSTRNSIAATFLLVMGEAKRYKYVAQVPSIELDKRHSQKKDIILDAELDVLFPECPAALALIWCRPFKRPRDREDPKIGIMFGALFALMVSGGLRPGEGRAVHLDQLYRKSGGLIIDRALDDAGDIGAPKKSKENDPRYRVAYIPERTWKIVDMWLARRTEVVEFPGLLFSYHGSPISPGFLSTRLDYGLAHAGVKKAGRLITPHSCRYTYDTKMKPILSPDVLREFVGHRTEAMSEHYDRATLRPALESRLDQLVDQRPNVELFWSRAKAPALVPL